MHTELINMAQDPPRILAYSKSIDFDGVEWRLTYHSEYGFGLQARVEYDFEDWVDVELVHDQAELADVISKLLLIGFDTPEIKLDEIQIGWYVDRVTDKLYPIKDFGFFGELEFATYGGEVM